MTAVNERIDKETVETAKSLETYKHGFVTAIESEKAPKGLSEETVAYISAKKEEPQWLLDWRLEAYRRWLKMDEPTWAHVKYQAIDYQDHYYQATKHHHNLCYMEQVQNQLLDRLTGCKHNFYF